MVFCLEHLHCLPWQAGCSMSDLLDAVAAWQAYAEEAEKAHG